MLLCHTQGGAAPGHRAPFPRWRRSPCGSSTSSRWRAALSSLPPALLGGAASDTSARSVLRPIRSRHSAGACPVAVAAASGSGPECRGEWSPAGAGARVCIGPWPSCTSSVRSWAPAASPAPASSASGASTQAAPGSCCQGCRRGRRRWTSPSWTTWPTGATPLTCTSPPRGCRAGRSCTCRCGTRTGLGARSCTATAACTCQRRPAATRSPAPRGARGGRGPSAWHSASWGGAPSCASPRLPPPRPSATACAPPPPAPCTCASASCRATSPATALSASTTPPHGRSLRTPRVPLTPQCPSYHLGPPINPPYRSPPRDLPVPLTLCPPQPPHACHGLYLHPRSPVATPPPPHTPLTPWRFPETPTAPRYCPQVPPARPLSPGPPTEPPTVIPCPHSPGATPSDPLRLPMDPPRAPPAPPDPPWRLGRPRGCGWGRTEAPPPRCWSWR